jgi:hypothetical protein
MCVVGFSSNVTLTQGSKVLSCADANLDHQYRV